MMRTKREKPKAIKVSVTKDKEGYSAGGRVKNGYILTQADTFDALKTNTLEAVNLHFEDQGLSFQLEDISFVLDLPSFFSHYKIINAKALAEKIGMSHTLLSQYVNGLKKPSENQVNKVLRGVKDLARELDQIHFA